MLITRPRLAHVRGTRAVLLSTSAALLLTLPFAQPALAQDQAAAEQVAAPPASPSEEPAPAAERATAGQDIVITGSRIARRDYEANSPIVTVDSKLLEQSATSSIEANLNKLPQFTAANLKTPTTGGGDIQPTARNTPGSAAISLRGIGTNRTLVLINGRRATPADATGTVDINTIPSAAIERVEIITGGASSTYGADAVAGVTNFILKSRFTGLELDGQLDLTQRGDGFEYQLSGIMGADFADNRGNINIAMSVNRREASYNRKRSWYRDLWADPNTTPTGFWPRTAGVALGFGNPVDPAVMAGIYDQATTPVPNQGIYVFVNPDGTVYSGFNNSDPAGAPGAYRSEIVDGYINKRLANGQLAPNFVDGYTVFPATRYTMLLQGNYDVNDWVTVFVQGNFNNTKTRSVQEQAPVVNGWAAQVDYDPANPQADIPQELRTILNARADPNAPFTIYQTMPVNRVSSGDVYSYNMTAGLRGRIPGSDFTWELYGSQGKTLSTVTQGGFASLQRYRTLINYGNFGEGFAATGNAEGGGFGASSATCTSGLNPFSGKPITDDCLEAIRADIKTKSTMQQTVWEGSLQGKLFRLPAGDVRTALGASYRKNSYKFENDTLTSQGQSFIEQAVGLYPSGNSAGSITAKEIFGELLVPILSDIPGIQELNLELGGRYSHYNTTGSSWTYKVLGDWKVTDWLRFRGGYNRAERAPNIAELYLAPEQTVAAAPGGDICSQLNGNPFSANPATNPTNAAKVESLCRVLMTRTGGPNAAQLYYDNGAPQPVGSAFVFPTLTGNPTLKPEKANTWTAGTVISSPFETPWLRRLRLTIDYYNIKVTDAIAAQSVDIAQRQCFDTQFNPTLDADSPFCAGINRNGDGQLGNVTTTFFNNGRFRTSGIDAAADWSMAAGPGNINLNVAFNYLISMKSSGLATLPMVEYAGTLGPTTNGLNGGSYRWRLFTSLGYDFSGYSLALQWQHLPSIDVETKATLPNTTLEGYPSYNIFNLVGSAKLTRDVVFRFGVENLFDKAPPLGNINSAPPAGQISGGALNAQFYDIIGRRFYIGLKTKF